MLTETILTETEKSNSFEAVRQFLVDGRKFIHGGNIPCYFIEGDQKVETTITISHVYHVPSYNLDDDVFKSYGLRNPIWSAYKLLEWDNVMKELVIKIDKHREIRLKRI